MAQPVRPKNVVIVDADNPLTEVRGEFFWLEDHDRIVMQERQSAYQAGYGQGYADAVAAAARKHRMVIRYRPPLLRRLIVRSLTLLVVVAFLVTLLGEMLGGNPQP